MDEALAERKNELEDIKVRSLMLNGPIQIVEQDPKREHFTYNSWHMVSYERKLCDKGLCNFIPMMFRYLPIYYRKYLNVDVAMMGVSPMDENGYFSFSINNATARAVMDVAKVVILEVNENLPRVQGIQNTVHISEVDMVVEGNHAPLLENVSSPVTETDEKIAKIIVDNMTDGSCIQLGAGAMPDAIGKMIAKSDLKNLGIHSELLTNAFLDMHKEGKITNRNKSGLFYGKSTFGLVYGTNELYDWVTDNPSTFICPMDFINNPRVISEIDNFVSINNCISVDLYGQISAESAGTRHISGTGGQLDFLTGAFENKNGKSFICMSSTFTDKKGIVHSRFKDIMNGDIVTDPRSQSYMIVTEYGLVNLVGLSTWERAEKLIGIAHPDFRDDLIKSAEKLKIWRRSNKR